MTNGRFLDGENCLLFLATHAYQRKKHYKVLLVDFDRLKNGFKEMKLPLLDSNVLSMDCLPTYLPHTHCYLLTESRKVYSIMLVPGESPINLNKYKLIVEEDLSKSGTGLSKPVFMSGEDYFVMTDKAKPTSFIMVQDGQIKYADSNELSETHPCHGAKTVGTASNSLGKPILLFQGMTGNTCFSQLANKL